MCMTANHTPQSDATKRLASIGDIARRAWAPR
jgi:hypothetical protein